VKDNQDEGELGGEENVGRTLRVRERRRVHTERPGTPDGDVKKIQVKKREGGKKYRATTE